MEKLNVLKDLIKIAEVLESNDKILLANEINFTITKLAEKEKACPDATQDIKLNLKNRQKAINEYGYGPADPSQPNDKFWLKKMKMWKVDELSEVKNMLCGNCAAFDITTKTLDCIESGIGEDATETINAGKLGYCKFLKFKCAAKRTCDAWVTGGPLTDKKNKK
jgi:hypothetical protein